MTLAYYPGRSIIHSLDPRAKLIFTIVFVVTALFGKTILTYGFLGIVILFPFLFTKLPPLRLIKGFMPFLILFALTILFHFFLTPGEVIFKCGFLSGTLEGIKNGRLFAVRLILIIVGTMLLGLTTSPIELSESLSGFFFRLKSRTAREIPMIMILVLRFIPFLIREGKRIVIAQRARGGAARGVKEFFTILFPIVNSALKQADQLALALHAKAYDPGESRTSFREYHFSSPDYLLLAYSIIPVLVVVLV